MACGMALAGSKKIRDLLLVPKSGTEQQKYFCKNELPLIEGTKRHKDVVLNHSGRLAAYPVLVVEKSIIIYYVAS